MTSSTSVRWSARQWGLLLVLCGVIVLDALDVSMVGMALPSIQSELGMSTSSLQWVVSAYVLGYGGLLLLGGRAADLLGRRRVLIIALAAFAVASLLGGLVDNGELLIAARFVKGVAAAFTAPAALSIITTTFAEGPERNRALSIYTTSGASGFSLGLILGGLLTEVDWRLTFLVAAPVAAILVFAARRLIPVVAAPERGRRGYDVVGAVTVTAAMLLLVYGVVQAPEAGWASPQTMGSLVAVIALLVAFVVTELRSPHPLVRLGILRSGDLVRANLGAMTMFGAYVGFQFVGTLYLQSLSGWSALRTALAFLPAGLIVASTAPWVGGLADRFGTRRLLLLGFASFATAYLLVLRIGPTPHYVAVMLPTMLLVGLGFAFTFPTLNIQATNGVADREQGLASGMLNTSVQVGGAIVLAVVTAVVSSNGADSSNAATVLDGYHLALGVIAGVAILGFLISASGLRSRTVRQTAPVPAEAAAEPALVD